jgi:hypothetical protein
MLAKDFDHRHQEVHCRGSGGRVIAVEVGFQKNPVLGFYGLSQASQKIDSLADIALEVLAGHDQGDQGFPLPGVGIGTAMPEVYPPLDFLFHKGRMVFGTHRRADLKVFFPVENDVFGFKFHLHGFFPFFFFMIRVEGLGRWVRTILDLIYLIRLKLPCQ